MQVPTIAERYVICRKLGAHVHLTAASKGLPGMKEYVEQLLADHLGAYSGWCPRQFENPENPTSSTPPQARRSGPRWAGRWSSPAS